MCHCQRKQQNPRDYEQQHQHVDMDKGLPEALGSQVREVAEKLGRVLDGKEKAQFL